MIYIRSFFFAIYFVLITIIMGIAALAIRFFAKNYALTYAQLWTHWSLKGLEKLCLISTEITGKEFLPKERSYLIACQHQSAFDTLVWMNIVPRPAYIMKKELIRIPLVGPMLTLSGMIPLDRQGGSKALRNLLQNTRLAVTDQRQIIIFPEGTRTNIGEKVKLQPGVAAIATQLELPVIPVSINSGRHWPRNSFLKFPGVIHIHIHPPIPPTTNRKKLLQAIENSWITTESLNHMD